MRDNELLLTVRHGAVATLHMEHDIGTMRLSLGSLDVVSGVMQWDGMDWM
jgi:hypothetical protein